MRCRFKTRNLIPVVDAGRVPRPSDAGGKDSEEKGQDEFELSSEFHGDDGDADGPGASSREGGGSDQGVARRQRGGVGDENLDDLPDGPAEGGAAGEERDEAATWDGNGQAQAAASERGDERSEVAKKRGDGS